MRSQISLAVTAVVLLLTTPHFAHAGPIGWGYHTEIEYAEDYGSRFIVTVAPDSDVQSTPGEPDYVWLFSSSAAPRPEPGEYRVWYEFTAHVTITDHASGESGTLSFGGGYETNWTYLWEDRNNPDAWRWDTEGSAFGAYWSRPDLQLGGNQYTVAAYGGGPGQFPYGEMSVEVNPITAPEPTTLALAALGLAGLGAARRVRKAVA